MLKYIYPDKCHLTPLVSPRINHYQSSTSHTLLDSSHALQTTSNRPIDYFHFSLCFVSAHQQYLHDTAPAAIAQYANYPHCHVPIQVRH